MRILTFAKRNFKEIIRDPLSIIFAILLPLFLLWIFQQFQIPNDAFNIENFTPGIIIFSFSFITLFTASLIARDRSTSLLIRLGISPMKPIEYIIGYTLALLPMAALQSILFFGTALLLGLNFNISIVYCILVSIPLAILFIALGILIGCITTEKSSAGLSSIIVQLVAFTSGMYFPTEMIGDVFQTVCNVLPFAGCVSLLKGLLNQSYENIWYHVIIILVYMIVITGIASFTFQKKMVSDKK